ncbi:MAG: hypothetical protein HC895_13280 [Leptolyngbyaceae cyanobacterium SM1_3_5]|nr:hypothetical protein [Leptolyngbyaceae cyanobacterium SM1_3_5]
MQRIKSRISTALHFNQWTTVLFYLFLATDIGFIILHFLHSYSALLIPGQLTADAFSLATDRGFSEVFQYLKEYWIALLLGFLAARNRSLLYLSWSLLFAYILLDDASSIHKRLGFFISKQLSFVPLFNLRAVDYGEMIVSAGVGLFFLIAIATVYRFGDRFARQVSKTLTLLLLALAFFGIVIDMLHIMLRMPALDPLLTALEDGGELIIMSIIACYALSQAVAKRAEQRVESRKLVSPIE